MRTLRDLRPANFLLSAMPENFYTELEPCLEVVLANQKQVIYERDKPIPYIYFPCDSVFSVLSIMQDGAAVEVGTTGYEGFVGIDVFIGSDIAIDTCVCQIEGHSIRISASNFKKMATEDTPLRRLAQRYLQAYISQMSQAVACNRLHTIEERFARWMLLTHDRVKSNEFHLTQEFIADMLGVHRPSVSLVANTFQQAGLIRYSRGKMSILNRAGLEDISCECYAAVRHHFEKFTGRTKG